MFKSLILFCLLTSIFGCIAKGRIDISLKKDNRNLLLNLSVAEVEVLNNQLVIKGSNLSGVTQVRLVSEGVTQSFSVESNTSSELIANGITVVSIGVGKIFDLILSNAHAAATVPITFSLDDNSITGIKLNDMGANNNDVLTFNGTQWIPSPPFSFGLYQGTWDPASGSYPPSGGLTDGDFFIVSASGTISAVSFDAGDWLIRDAGTWARIESGSNSVTSYNGRKSLVVTLPSDYVLMKNGSGKIPGSSLNDLANVDLTTSPPVNGNVLKYNGTAWVPGTAGGAAGAIGSTEITDLSITGADIAENTINPSKIYSASIDNALYLRGDKTWANFTDGVLNVPLTTYTINATVKPTLAITDKIQEAFGKIQKFLNDLNGDYISKTATSQVVSGTFSFTSPTSFLYTQLPSGASPTEVTNVQYVQNYVGSALSGVVSSVPTTLTTANGGASAGDNILTVVSTAGYPSAGTLLVGSEAISYTGTTSTTFTGLTRGAFGTTAASISNGATINNFLLMAKTSTTTSPKLVVTGTGNVGIGTTGPASTSKLEVKGSSSDSSASGLSITNSGGSSQFIVRNDGYVGVNAGSPNWANTLLQVGTPSTTFGEPVVIFGQSKALSTYYTTVGIYGTGFGQNEGGTLGFGGEASAGARAIFTAIGGRKESASSGTNDSYLQFATAGGGGINAPTEKMRISSIGNVGIGTASPTSTLDVRAPSASFGANSISPFNVLGSTATAASSGSISIRTGDADINSGSITIQTGYASTTGGAINIITGMGDPGGLLTLKGSGGVAVETGLTDTGIPMAVNISTATSPGMHNGGAINLTAGNSNGSGNGGIITINPGAAMGAGSHGNIVLANLRGNVGIGLTSPTYQLQLSSDSAAKPGTSTWTVASDERLKDIRALFTRGLKEINNLETVYFRYKENNALDLPTDKEYVGIKAQDVLKVIPEAVSKDEQGFFHVTNDSIIWTAVNAIKELFVKLVGTDSKIKKLESENGFLKSKVQFIEKENIEIKKRLERLEKIFNQQKL